MNTNYAVALMDAHRYPEAKAEFQKELQRDPSFGPAHHKFANLLAANGEFGAAIAELRQFISTEGTWSPDAKGYRELAEAGFSGRPEGNAWLAASASITGDRNKAFDYLERAYANREIELVLCIRYPTFDPIRSDPRYADLMRRMGLPE
jgi:predicted Zn-dependent protease